MVRHGQTWSNMVSMPSKKYISQSLLKLDLLYPKGQIDSTLAQKGLLGQNLGPWIAENALFMPSAHRAQVNPPFAHFKLLFDPLLFLDDFCCGLRQTLWVSCAICYVLFSFVRKR